MQQRRRGAQYTGRGSTPDPAPPAVKAVPDVGAWPLLALFPYNWARFGHALRPWSFTASYFPMVLTALCIATVPESSEALWTGQEPQFLAKFVVVLMAGLSAHAGANLTNTCASRRLAARSRVALLEACTEFSAAGTLTTSARSTTKIMQTTARFSTDDCQPILCLRCPASATPSRRGHGPFS